MIAEQAHGRFCSEAVRVTSRVAITIPVCRRSTPMIQTTIVRAHPEVAGRVFQECKYVVIRKRIGVTGDVGENLKCCSHPVEVTDSRGKMSHPIIASAI